MAERQWEEQFRHFWRKTGEDLRRTSEDIRTEAQRLFETVLEPTQQQRVREGWNELRTWAKRTADDLARRVEKAANEAEEVVQRAAQTVSERAAHYPATQAVHRAVRSRLSRSVRTKDERSAKRAAGPSTGENRTKKAKKRTSPRKDTPEA